jgi:uncharacterized C2H2 Zn-finger protein
MLYKCKRCGYYCHQKNDLRKHFNRKNVCKPVLINIDVTVLLSELDGKKQEGVEKAFKGVQNGVEGVEKGVEKQKNVKYIEKHSYISSENPEYKCSNCGNIFKKKKYLTQHINRYNCKKTANFVSQTEIVQIKNELNLIKQEKESLKKQLELLMIKRNKSNINIENQTNISNQINNNINIQINSFGNEDIEYISSDFYKNLFNGPYGAIPKLIQQIHFNPEHPENWNVKIVNDKSSKADIYDAKQCKWVKRDKQDTLNSLVEKGYGILDDQFENQKIYLQDNIIYKYSNFQKKYDKGDKKIEKQLEKDTREILINYKEHFFVLKN